MITDPQHREEPMDNSNLGTDLPHGSCIKESPPGLKSVFAHPLLLVAMAPLMGLFLSGCAPKPGSVLQINAPSRIQQAATSDDADLCNKLEVDFTFDRSNDLAGPLLENEPMAQSYDEPCLFELQGDHAFSRGTYDMLVRFIAKSEVYTGWEECEANNSTSELWVGAYWYEAVTFPFDDDFAGFTDAQFYSYAGDEADLNISGVNFDPDRDGRDNLSEVATQTGPCVENAIPEANVLVEDLTGTEGTPHAITLRSVAEDETPHEVRLYITQEHGPQAGTETVTFVSRTDTPNVTDLIPRPQETTPLELWSLDVVSVEATNPGEATWTILFTPDEPFVGALTLRAETTDGKGLLLDEGETVTITIDNVVDETILLMENENGQLTTISSFSFREVGDSGEDPTVARVRLQNNDINTDANGWRPELVSGPDGLTLDQDPDSDLYWQLTWSPTNAQAVASGPSVYAAEFLFYDPDNQLVSSEPQSFPLFVDPLWNDAPIIGDLNTADTSLPSGNFVSKTVAFSVTDPDQVSEPPSCAVALSPFDNQTPATCDAGAFDEIRCEASGQATEGVWPFALELFPATDFRARCGDDPQLRVQLTITDTPPVGAQPNEAASVATQATCTSGTCQEDLIFNTVSLVSGEWMEGLFDVFDTYLTPEHLLYDGVLQRGLLNGTDSWPKVAGLDYSLQPAAAVHEFPRTTICDFRSLSPYKRMLGVVDEVNHLAYIIAKGSSNLDTCDGENELKVIDLNDWTLVSTHALTELCPKNNGSIGRFVQPLMSQTGDAYFLCYDDGGEIARLRWENQAVDLQVHDLGVAHEYANGMVGGSLISAQDGTLYMVSPDTDGFLLINLDTFDESSISTTRITGLPMDWNSSDIEDAAVNPERFLYLAAYAQSADAAQLWKIDFSGASPSLGAPLELGDVGGSSSSGSSYLRIVQKVHSAGAPLGEPDVIMTGGVSEIRPHVDLDSWAVVEGRDETAYYGIQLLIESPQPGTYLGLLWPNSASWEESNGVALFPFDPTQAPVSFSLIDIPTNVDLAAYETFVSHSGNVVTLFEDSTMGREISVLRFPQAL